MKLSELYLNRYLYRDNNQEPGTKDSTFVSADSSEAVAPGIPSGGAAQDINTGNVEIDGAIIEPGTIPETTLDVSNWGWGQTCAFSSTDLDTVSWGAGTFTSANGVAYAIGAGNTGNMAAKTYIYLDLNVSEIAYQVTTVSATAVGTGKVLIAVAENAADDATYMLSEATQIVGDNILVNTIDASKIIVGQLIVGTNVAIGTAEDAAGVTTIVGDTINTGYVNALAITVLGTVTAGEIQVINGGNTIGLTPGGVNAIFAGTTGSPEFKVTPAGAVTCTNITISGGSIQWSTVAGTTNAPDSNADITGSNTSNDTSFVNGLASGTLISGGIIGTNLVEATSINVGTLSAITANVGTLTSGTITGVTFKTTASGSERIELTGDNMVFYAGGAIKATLDGTTAGSGGVRSTGDWFTANNKSFFIADTTGGSTKYGGMTITNGNELWLTMGTDDTFYVKNNAQDTNHLIVTSTYTQMAAAVFSTGEYIDSNAGGNDMRYYAGDNHEFYQGTTIKGIIDENIWTAGDLQADGSKPFVISHPDGTKDKLLRYTAQESPEVILRHRGKATTDGLGKTTITLPTHFTLVTDPAGDVTVNLTPIGDNHIFLEEEPTNEKIRIGSSAPNTSFHYEVMAVRNGYLNRPVELDLGDKTLSEEDIGLINKIKNIPKKKRNLLKIKQK